MVTLQTFGTSSVKFTFLNNALYLNNGEITVPLNSLMLVIDDSGLATFKKLNGDPFVSVSYADLGMDKDELEQWYKDNMVGGTGGSSSGITPSEVQDMIDASISGYDEDIQDEIGEKEQVIAIALTELKNDKIDTSDYETYTAATDATLATKADKNEIPSVSGYADSVEYNSTTKYVNFYHGGTGGTVVYSFNAAPFVIDGMVQNVVISGGSLVISFNTDAGKQDISIPLTEIFDPANYYDKTATDAAINAATSGKVDTSAYTAYTGATDARLAEDEEVTAAALNALEDELANKQDALVAGDNITISGNVISADGGGKAIEGGRGITVTTGETADTVSFNLPISAGTSNGVRIGSGNASYNGLVHGIGSTASGTYSNVFAWNSTGNGNYSITAGGYLQNPKDFGAAFGQYNTYSPYYPIFSVGNGTSNSARHNAFQILDNGDIYITSGGTDIKLQDNLGGGSITIDPTLDSGSTNAVANSAITTAFNNIEDRLGEDEEVTAAGLNALNDGINSVNDKFGGLRIVKLSQQEYDALVTKDSFTLYIVV